MIDQVIALEKCWYLSPYWGEEIPPLRVNLWERTYLRNTRTFGYCCGYQWTQQSWIYTIACGREVVQVKDYQIVGTGRLLVNRLPKPKFLIAERVMLRLEEQAPLQRLILGIHLLNGTWFYFIEWISPMISEVVTIENRLALVSEKDLVRVRV